MKKKFWLMQLPIILLICGILGTVAVAQTTNGKKSYTYMDTIPANDKKIKNMENVLSELELSKGELEKSLKEVDWLKIEKEIQQAMKTMDIDMAKMQADLQKSMKEIDVSKINAELQKALKEVNAANIQEQVQKSLRDFDMSKIDAEIKEALNQVNSEKIQKQIKESLANVDMKKIQQEIEKVKSVDLSKMQKELQQIKPEIEKAMKEAKVDIEKAQKEMEGYQNFIDQLEKDQLLSKKQNYSIEYKNGELHINGKKLSADQQSKYADFLKGKADFNIKKNNDHFNFHRR